MKKQFKLMDRTDINRSTDKIPLPQMGLYLFDTFLSISM